MEDLVSGFKDLKEKNGMGLALLWLFLVLSAFFFLGGYCIQYTAEYWIGFTRDNPVVIPFAACGLVSCLTRHYKLYLTLFLMTWLVRIAN